MSEQGENTQKRVYENAKRWFERGFNVIPIKLIWDENDKKYEKRPNGTRWKQWEDRRQTSEEFEKLKWMNLETRCFAIVPTKMLMQNGYYFGSIDIDLENFDLSLLPKTLTDKTIKNRFHSLFFSKTPIHKRKCRSYELLAGGNMICMYCNFVDVNTPIAVVENLDKLYREFLISQLEPAPDHERNKETFNLARDLRNGSFPFAEAEEIIVRWNEHNKPPQDMKKLLSDIQAAYNYQKPFDAKKKEEDENKPEESPGGVTESIIFEQIEGNKYAVWVRKTNQKDEKTTVEGYGPLEILPWLAAPKIGEYESEENLFEEVRSFYVKHLDLMYDYQYDILTAWTLLTWVIEDLVMVPYLRLIGPKGSGKTRVFECLEQLCYRAHIVGNISKSALFRMMNQWHPTLLLDEAQVYTKYTASEIIAVLDNGHRRGKYVWLTMPTENGDFVLRPFDPFGCKAIAGTELPEDTVEDRCIPFEMSRAEPNKVQNRVIDEEWARSLRAKLLMFRFRKLGTIDWKKELNAIDQEKVRNLRVADLFVGLLVVVPAGKKDILQKAMEDLSQEREEQEKSSIEAQVFNAILEWAANKDNKDKLKSEKKIGVQDVADVVNKYEKLENWISNDTIGRAITRMGFARRRMKGGTSGFL